MRARIIMLCVMLLCLISSVQAADLPDSKDRGRNSRFGWPMSRHTAVIHVSERIVLGNNAPIPFSVDIKTSDGEPFTSQKHGQVHFYTRYGGVTVDGERWSDRLNGVEVQNGKVEALLALNFTAVTDDLYIAVLQGTYPNLEILGVAWIEVLYADSYEILYDQSRLTAEAGGCQPACVRLVAYDQHKRPLSGLRVRGMFHNPAYDDEDIWVETDSDGIATVQLPMRPKEEHEFVQMLLGGGIATKQVWIRYSEEKPQEHGVRFDLLVLLAWLWKLL